MAAARLNQSGSITPIAARNATAVISTTVAPPPPHLPPGTVLGGHRVSLTNAQPLEFTLMPQSVSRAVCALLRRPDLTGSNVEPLKHTRPTSGAARSLAVASSNAPIAAPIPAPPTAIVDGTECEDEISALLFPADNRLREARRLLCASRYKTQRVTEDSLSSGGGAGGGGANAELDMTHQKFRVAVLGLRTMASMVGRAALTLGTAPKSLAQVE